MKLLSTLTAAALFAGPGLTPAFAQFINMQDEQEGYESSRSTPAEGVDGMVTEPMEDEMGMMRSDQTNGTFEDMRDMDNVGRDDRPTEGDVLYRAAPYNAQDYSREMEGRTRGSSEYLTNESADALNRIQMD